jgi:hypothetical protein
VPRDPQSHSLADRQIFFHEATVDAQELRRKFAQNSKSSVYRVYASAVACGTRSPVVILLDLRDRLACEIALASMTPDALANKLSADKSNELMPLLVFPLSSVDAAALIGARSSKAGELLRKPAGRSRFRLIIVGHGGMTCTSLRTPTKKKVVKHLDGRGSR